MLRRCSIWALTGALLLTWGIAAARAGGDMKYPDWEGQWVRLGNGGVFDPTKALARAQQIPYTPEYQAVWDKVLADALAGGQKYNPQIHCYPSGMPRMMMAYDPMQMIVTPNITYVQVSFASEFRRIYTDGRDWPDNPPKSFSGYSIGKWVDEDGDGSYDVLEVETRALRGPRTFDGLGSPLHEDDQTIIKERLYLDKADENVLSDEITTIDHALSRPWTVTRSYQRDRHETWLENFCAESNQYLLIGGETVVRSMDGYLMPTKKGQPPPDLRYFSQPPK